MVNFIIHFGKLIRFKNLLIIAFTQYAMRHFIIEPLAETHGFELMINHTDFFLISLSTVLIAAAGYVINDYFDLKIDRINKPNKIIIDKHIKRRVAMGAHIVMNILAVLISIYTAYFVAENLNLIFLQLFAIFSLWYYSTHFKYQPFLGNFVIALMAAFIPLIVGLYEIPLLNKWGIEAFRIDQMGFNFNHIAYYIIAFSAFAFLLTFIREMIKDVEDIEGDQKYGAETVPIAYGIKTTKSIIISLYIITCALVIYIQQSFLNDFVTMIYISTSICLPILISCYLTFKANDKKDYSKLSLINKYIWLAGLIYCFIFPYLLNEFIS
jgi:4-hydroxybenzoate polyprenyltransferase